MSLHGLEGNFPIIILFDFGDEKEVEGQGKRREKYLPRGREERHGRERKANLESMAVLIDSFLELKGYK